MPFTNFFIALVLFALTVVIRGSLLMLRGAVMQVLPRQYIRPIDAGQATYGLFYYMVCEVLQVLDLVLYWIMGVAALLLTAFLFWALAWTAVFTVNILGDLAIAVLNWAIADIGGITNVYVRIVLRALICLMKALLWLFSQLLAVAWKCRCH
jgi:hypothetical protein